MGRNARGKTEPPELQKAHDRTDAATALQQQRALEMRLAGATYQQIATAVGYSGRAAAYKAIHRLMERVEVKLADDYRDLEAARLDRLLVAWWPKALGGSLPAAQYCLKLSESRRRLFGLDAPLRIHGTFGSKLDEEIETLVAQLGGTVPPPAANAEEAPDGEVPTEEVPADADR